MIYVGKFSKSTSVGLELTEEVKLVGCVHAGLHVVVKHGHAISLVSKTTVASIYVDRTSNSSYSDVSLPESDSTSDRISRFSHIWEATPDFTSCRR